MLPLIDIGGSIVSELSRDERRKEARKLASEGMSVKDIATQLKVSTDTVYRDIKSGVLNKQLNKRARVPGTGVELVQPSRRARVEAPKSARVSTESGGTPGSNLYNAIIPPPDYTGTWQTLALNPQVVQKLTANQLATAVVDVVPDVARAYWDFVRMFDPGHEVKVYWPNGSTRIHTRGQELVNQFLDMLRSRYGSFTVVTSRLAGSAFLRGAVFTELVLDEAGTRPVDLAIPDPASVRFRKVNDPVIGETFEIGQMQGGKWVSLNVPTIRYLPIDPLPGVPYGRPMVAPAMFMALFLLGMFHDLRRVIAQQGYPRLVIDIDVEKVQAFNGLATADELREAVNAIMDQVQDVWSGLEPDDVYIKPSTIKVEDPVGTVDANSLQGADAMIRALERQLVKALKTTPLMMGNSEGVSEANSNRQWEMYVAGIKSIQHLAEQALEYQLELALQVQGVQAKVEFRFAEIRSSEQLRDEQTLQLALVNAEKGEDLGYMTRDEASIHAVKHKAATKERVRDPKATNPNTDPDTSVDGNEDAEKPSD